MDAKQGFEAAEEDLLVAVNPDDPGELAPVYVRCNADRRAETSGQIDGNRAEWSRLISEPPLSPACDCTKVCL